MLYYLSLGSNLGNREHLLRQALTNIEQQIGTLLRCSSLYYSEPWGFTSEHEFCNLCCAVETDKTPLEVLHLTQAIERSLGRTRKSDGHYADRTIDIDIIRAFDQGHEIKHQSNELVLPHPLWEQRDFVRIPLEEIFSL